MFICAKHAAISFLGVSIHTDMSILDPKSPKGRDSIQITAHLHEASAKQVFHMAIKSWRWWCCETNMCLTEHQPTRSNPTVSEGFVAVAGRTWHDLCSPVTLRSSSWSFSMYSSICSFSCSCCSASSDRSSWFFSICSTMCRLPLRRNSAMVS